MLTALLLASLVVANSGGDEIDKKILAKDDIKFARELARAGFPDLADEVLSAYARANPSDRDAAMAASSVRAELEANSARRELDLDKRLQLMISLVEEQQAFVQTNSGTPAGDEALHQLPDRYREVGELTTKILEKETDAERAKELRTKGSSMFERAVDALKLRIDELKGKVAAEDDKQIEDENYQPNEALLNEYMLARYSLARTCYFHALLLEEGGFARKSRLETALDIWKDFQLDYAQQLSCYEGFIYEGLCRQELGQADVALECFESAIRLREAWNKGSDGKYPVEPEAADIISIAVLQKMIALAKKGDSPGAAAAARDFFKTIPDGEETLKGAAILVEECEAYKKTGDRKMLEQTAKRLIDLDPNGPAGDRGREFIGGGAVAMSAGDKMKLAQTTAGRGEVDRAIGLCQEVMTEARGNADLAIAADDNLGTQSGLLLGTLEAQRGWWHEAVTAWEGTADRFPKGKEAPDCMWQAVNGYLQLLKDEQASYYRTRARDRMSELATRYPDHPLASKAAIFEGQQAEAEGDFVKAAGLYERVASNSPSYEESIYRAGKAWSNQARKLKADSKPGDAKQAATKAEELLKKAQTALIAGAGKTLEISAQDRFKGLAFAARVALGELYLMDFVNRADEVLPLFANVENEFPGDTNKISAARGLRLRALQQTGKLDEAITLLDSLLRDDPNARGLGSNAVKLAQALDKKAGSILEKDPNSRDADELLRKAARFYMLAVRGQLDGSETVNSATLEPIAQRLFALALHFNRVPKNVTSFVEWNGPRIESELFEQAQAAYEALIPLTPSYRTSIALAQTQGYLARWTEAASLYAQIFDREPLVDPVSRQMRQEVVRAKPELVFAYLEWGVCEREAGLKESDSTRMSRALNIFETLVLGNPEFSPLWWKAKYFQIRTMVDRGDYNAADIAVRSVERGAPNFDEGQFGLKDKFIRIRDDMATKVPQNSNSGNKSETEKK